MFNYKIKPPWKANYRQCWPAIIRSLTAIVLFSILLCVTETFILYAHRDCNANDQDYGGISPMAMILCAIINSAVLRRYILIISPEQSGNPRRDCHALISVYSFIFIAIGGTMVQYARTEMLRSDTLDAVSLEGGRYYYIDQALTIDTALSQQYIVFEPRHRSREYQYQGYYVAPVSGQSSVFCCVRLVGKYSTHQYTESASSDYFKQLFEDSISRIGPTLSNHLFRCVSPQASDYEAFCEGIRCSSATSPDIENCASAQQDDYRGPEALITPVEGDRMPHWSDLLGGQVTLLIFYIVLLTYSFSSCQTEERQ